MVSKLNVTIKFIVADLQCCWIHEMGACALCRNPGPNSFTTSTIFGRVTRCGHCHQGTKERNISTWDSLMPAKSTTASSPEVANVDWDITAAPGSFPRSNRWGHRRRRRRLRLFVWPQPRLNPVPRRLEDHRRGRCASTDRRGHQMWQL